MEILICVLCVITISLVIILLLKKNKIDDSIFEDKFSNLRKEINSSTMESVQNIGKILSDNQNNISQMQQKQFTDINTSLNNSLVNLEERFKTFSLENEQKLDLIRSNVEKKLTYIQEDNNKKLDEINKIVDEKLQKTLEDRMTKSFNLVNERLEAVHKGLGEMQNLANSVGDLKKVLSNVKTRGILGEIQLGAILEEILSPEQYDTNVATKKGSRDVVEFAVKIPMEDDKFIYLPIDSKLPLDTYQSLLEAYDTMDKQRVDTALKALISVIKSEAKDISSKYIDVPNTTEFAIMFLPFEGLYAEVVKVGLIEILQRDYRVNIAGPTTMAALLNSLQMGFKSFALRQRSTEVWEVLGAVKTEFDKFEKVLSVTQQRLNQANDELDKLVGTRTRQIQRKLKDVTSLPEESTAQYFDNE